MSLQLIRLNKPPTKFPSSLPVTAQTKASTTEPLKGLYGPILRYRNESRLHSKEANVYNGKYFLARYYPPNHFLSLFRKTKPAINVKFTRDVSFLNECGSYIKKRYAGKKSVVPADYAVWRRKLTVLLKRTFQEEWIRQQGPEGVNEAIRLISENDNDNHNVTGIPELSTPVGLAKDGFYEFQVYKYPGDDNSIAEFREAVRKTVGVVARLDWNEFMKPKNVNTKSTLQRQGKSSESWVDAANKSVNVSVINTQMRGEHLPYKLVRKRE